jgi:hypothetical protein
MTKKSQVATFKGSRMERDASAPKGWAYTLIFVDADGQEFEIALDRESNARAAMGGDGTMTLGNTRAVPERSEINLPENFRAKGYTAVAGPPNGDIVQSSVGFVPEDSATENPFVDPLLITLNMGPATFKSLQERIRD